MNVQPRTVDATPVDGTPTGVGREPAGNRWSRLIRVVGSRRVWVPTVLVFVVFAATLFGSSAPYSIPTVTEACGQAPPDVRFHSSGDEVLGFLEDCGVAGRDAYRHLQLADLFYPLVFGVFLASSIALVAARTGIPARWVTALATIPLAGTMFDYIENLFAWSALERFPAPTTAGELLGFASTLKTATFWISVMVLVVAAGALAARRIRRRSTDRPAPAIPG